MQLSGQVFSGAMRGKQLIELYHARLSGILGFQPYQGTMDIKLERAIDITHCATKALDHMLIDGSRMVYAYLAPVTLIIHGQRYDCWIMQQADGVYSRDIVEVVAKDRLKDKFSIEDGDTVIVELTELKQPQTFMQKFVSKTKAGVKQVRKKK
ncbi:MAG: DUF120 domain-containing protein [Candidatus Aenigmarchaeota archaeon]|nr:DUF120 domain-containing protein [Candidatus Aenigmarchaeota archaeon]